MSYVTHKTPTPPGLLPCPFCGSNNLKLTRTGDLIHFVFCDKCGCDGPFDETPDLGVAAWNKRVSPPSHRERLAAYLNQIGGTPNDVALSFLGAFADYLDRQ